MVSTGADGLSRRMFDQEGLTLSQAGVRKFREDLKNAVAEAAEERNVSLGGAFPTNPAIDVLASPRQNPFGTKYLSRTDDRIDSQSLHFDFWSFKYCNFHFKPEDYLYAFPPPKMTLAAAQHIAENTCCSSAWLVEGRYVGALYQIMSAKPDADDYMFVASAFARKGNPGMFKGKKNNRKITLVAFVRKPEITQPPAKKVRFAGDDYDEAWKLYSEDVLSFTRYEYE